MAKYEQVTIREREDRTGFDIEYGDEVFDTLLFEEVFGYTPALQALVQEKVARLQRIVMVREFVKELEKTKGNK